MDEKVIQNMPVDRLVCEPQVREHFDEDALVGLAQSIREVGILQPLLVRRQGDSFVVLEGERRLRAARRAGLAKVPAIIDDREMDGVGITLRQLVVNSQREDLTQLERARAFARLIEESGWTAAEVARRTGFSEATVSRHTALLTLPPDVLRRVEAGEIPASTAYQIAIAGDGETQARLAEAAANGGLTRDALVERTKQIRSGRTRRKPRRDRARCPRVTIPLDEERMLIVSGPSVKIQEFVSWLQVLLSRFSGLTPQIELSEAVKALARKEK